VLGPLAEREAVRVVREEAGLSRRLYIFPRREKTEDGKLRCLVSHKGVYRLYREEGLAMLLRRRNDFGPKHEYGWCFRLVRTKCGRWTTRMTSFRAGGDSGH
jgi:hypothetical protein